MPEPIELDPVDGLGAGTVGSRSSAASDGSAIASSGYSSAIRSKNATASVASSATCSFSTSTVSWACSFRACR